MDNFTNGQLSLPGATDARAAFITRTYTHVVGAILGFLVSRRFSRND